MDCSTGGSGAETATWWFLRRGRMSVLLLGGLTLLLAACGSSDSALVTQPNAAASPTPTASLSATAERTATPSATEVSASASVLEASPTAAPTEPSTPLVTDLRTLIDTYGYPATATYARLRVPKLGVDAQVGTKVVGETAALMPNPDGPADIAWYDLSAWSGLGGAPGAGGNAIFGGHVDYAAPVSYAGVDYRGVGVFKDLKTLSIGDVVEVDFQGETLSYAVVWSSQFDADGTDWGQIWSSDVAIDSITLYTCGGVFDAASSSYRDRVVVRAERI